MITPFDNNKLASVVDYVTHKEFISNTTLRLFIQPQVSKRTNKLRQIWGCDICIIPKDLQIDLNIFRTILITDLQQKSIRRHTYTTVYLLLQVICITKIKCLYMVDAYMLLSKMLLSSSTVFLLN